MLDFNKIKTIPEAILEYRDSQKTAVCCGGKTLSYHELIRDSRRLAHALRKKGTGKGSYVMLCMTRSVDMITALLGILYAGAAYVAVDPEWPKSRLDFIKKDCGDALVLNDDIFYTLVGQQDESAGWGTDELPELEASDEMAVYYTSGSTGQPKGAVTHHGVLYDHVIPVPQNTAFYETARSCDVVFSVGNFAFAGTIGDIFCSLLNGLTLVLATRREQQSPSLLGECMLKHHVDALQETPSMLLRYLEDERFKEGVSHLKRIILSGEPLSESWARRICAATEAVVFDLFGSSEAQSFAITRVVPGKKIDLGTPVYGARLYVLDQGDDLHEAGETGQRTEGELCIGGMPAQYGCYIGREDLTARKFTMTEGHGRIYHTGDLAVLQEDGHVSLVGRLDSLIKLRGQRLEPGEVAAVMEAFPGIGRAVVDIRGEGPDAMLFAWYTVSKTEAERHSRAGQALPSDSGGQSQNGTAHIDESTLKGWLLDRLPAYMVPVRFMAVDSFPLNSNGKLDRRALPDIPAREAQILAPENDLERLICDAFSKVLPPGADTGRNTGFFEAGGDSIRAMSLIGLLQDSAEYSLSMAELMKNQTPALLAELLKAKGHILSEEDDRNENTSYPFDLPDEMLTVRDDTETEAIFPVTNVTLSYLYLKLYGIADADNVTHAQIRIPGIMPETEFRDRIHCLTGNHPSLRSHFLRDRSGKYWHVIRRGWEAPVYYKDISSMTRKESDYFASGFWQIMDREGGLFSAACLILPGNESLLLVRVDHTICDGISVNIIVSELTDPEYRQFTGDHFLSHRLRTLTAYMTPPEGIREYYKNAIYRWKSMETQRGNHSGREMLKVRLNIGEYERLSGYLAKRGITFYSYLQYSYGRAWLDTLKTNEIWLLNIESGRYPGWPDELRIVGNLIIGVPVRITFDMTPEAFQENLFLLRSGPYLSDNREIPGVKWVGIYEGITSSEFSGSGERGMDFKMVEYSLRSGSSMRFEEGDLLVELRYPGIDIERKRYRQVAERLREYLTSYEGQ